MEVQHLGPQHEVEELVQESPAGQRENSKCLQLEGETLGVEGEKSAVNV